MLVERDIGVALDARVAVPGGFTVAHGQDAGDLQGRLSGKGSDTGDCSGSGRAEGYDTIRCMTPSPHDGDFSTLFNFLPIGAYRSSADGHMIRANQALVALNGYATEADLIEGVKDIAIEWYVDPARRAEFKQQLERDGYVRGFVSEIYRHKTRERVWISENAHAVRDAAGVNCGTTRARWKTSPSGFAARRPCSKAKKSCG